MSKEILKLENVEKKYSGSVEELHIINNLSFSVEEGEFISILGRSGSGKSTLLNIMGLLDRVDGGKIFIGGQEVDKLSEEEIVELDEEKKAAMVSNLLVVLCADEAAQPVVNTGTLNH